MSASVIQKILVSGARRLLATAYPDCKIEFSYPRPGPVKKAKALLPVVVARAPLPKAVCDKFYAINDEIDAVVRRHLPEVGPYQRPWYWLIEQVPGASAFLEKQLERFPAGHWAQFDVPLFPARNPVVEIYTTKERAQ